MKKIFTLLAVVFLTASVFAQSPEKMSYQAVIRNSSDVLVTDTQVGMQISIIQGTADGSPVYVETQTPTTNANGLVSFEIGTGTVESGGFTTIDWANGPYFIKTETDPTGSTDYTITGTNQLLSVPYALHAKTAEAVTESDPLFTSWDKSTGISVTESQISDLGSYIENETDPIFDASPAVGINTADIANWDEAHSWGNHSEKGYLETETDPVYAGSVASDITAGDTTNWNEAHGWGNHAEAEYITEEADPIFASSIASGIIQEDVESWDAKSEFDGEFSSLTGVPNSIFMPAGVINIFAGSVAPDGYLICDGSEVSRTEYADLFAVIGTAYGAGDGSNTFNLPDLQSRIPVGISAEPEFDELGKTGGAKEHLLTVDEMPVHNHTGSTVSAGGHTHSGSTGTAGSHSHSANTSLSGMVKPMRLSSSVVATHTANGTHSSIGLGDNRPYTYSPAASTAIHTAGAHTHPISIATAGYHTHSVTINNSGGSSAHNNLQPYIVLNFIIKY